MRVQRVQRAHSHTAAHSGIQRHTAAHSGHSGDSGHSGTVDQATKTNAKKLSDRELNPGRPRDRRKY